MLVLSKPNHYKLLALKPPLTSKKHGSEHHRARACRLSFEEFQSKISWVSAVTISRRDFLNNSSVIPCWCYVTNVWIVSSFPQVTTLERCSVWTAQIAYECTLAFDMAESKNRKPDEVFVREKNITCSDGTKFIFYDKHIKFYHLILIIVSNKM